MNGHCMSIVLAAILCGQEGRGKWGLAVFLRVEMNYVHRKVTKVKRP
jgi:hypothetical protein